MNEQQFVARHEADWIRLNTLAAKADLTPKNLTGSELRELFRLYKRVSTHLSIVRTKSTNAQLAQFLNDLAGKAYGALYHARRRSLLSGLASAIAIAAQTVRRRKGAVLLSAAVFVGGAVFANLLLRALPHTRAHFIPMGWEETVRSWRDEEMGERNFGEATIMTGFYLSNNPRASIFTGAVAAATFGVGSAKLLFDNGVLLGALAYELEPVGRVGYLFLRVLPHGVPELTGIVMAGAAGFVMGWALIHPGRRRRGEALMETGKDAIVLLCTSVVLMFIAAPIEGYFSFNPYVPDVARGLVIFVSAVAWGLFWVGFGRTPEELESKRLKRATKY